MIYAVLFFLMSIVFLVLFLRRLNAGKKIEVTAIIKYIKEEETIVSYQVSHMKFFHPYIEYRYKYNDQEYIGGISHESKRKYWVDDSDDWNTSEKDEKLFWRNMKIGDSLLIRVNPKKPSASMLSRMPNKNYRSETAVFLVVCIIFFLISFAFLVLQ